MKDYRIVESLNGRGGIRSETEYIGAPYFFEEGREQAGRTGKRVLLLCLVGWTAFIGALLPNSAGMRTLYVSLPFAFAALPLAMLTDLMLSSLRVKEPMERRTADKLDNRFPAQTLALAALPAFSLVGEGIRLLADRQSMMTGDLIFSLCAALLLGCGVAAFRCRKRLRTRKG